MAKTVEEVAAATGVSVTTVRLVTNNQADRYRISAATQQRVRAYVEAHGIRINQVARSLKLQRSEAIGLVIPEISNPFFSALMAALEALCRNDGLVLLTASTQDRPEQACRAIDTLVARGVDGLIVAPSTSADHAAAIARRDGRALVFVDRIFPDPPWAAVATDHHRSSLALTASMLAADNKPIAFLCANPGLPSIAARLQGFRETIAIARPVFSALELQSDADSVAGGRALMAELLAQRSLGSHGILCSSLLVLEGVLAEIRARRARIGAELLLGTFDDHPMLDFLSCRVMSATQDVTAIAQAAFDLLRKGSPVTPDPAMVLVPGLVVKRMV